MRASDPERHCENAQPCRKSRSALVSPALALPALASTTGRFLVLMLGLIAVVVLVLGLVALLRCNKKDIPAVVRGTVRRSWLVRERVKGNTRDAYATRCR
jgi:hypothetical protein